MLHDRRNDPEFVQAIEAVREQLAAAKDRVREAYPHARIRWVVETSLWAVVDLRTGETIEISSRIEDVASGRRSVRPKPQSGTHRKLDRDEE
jgi:hypothetical protein